MIYSKCEKVHNSKGQCEKDAKSKGNGYECSKFSVTTAAFTKCT